MNLFILLNINLDIMSWSLKNDKLVKEFKVDKFSTIINNLNKLSMVADEQNHHPDFNVFGYNKIRFELSTHDANSVTEKDYSLAKSIDLIFTDEGD